MRAKNSVTQKFQFWHKIFWIWHFFWKHLNRIPLGYPSPTELKKRKTDCQIQKILCQNWNFFVTAFLAQAWYYAWYYHFEDISIISGSFCKKFDRKEGRDVISKSFSDCVRKKWQNSTQQQNEKFSSLAGRTMGVILLWGFFGRYLHHFWEFSRENLTEMKVSISSQSPSHIVQGKCHKIQRCSKKWHFFVQVGSYFEKFFRIFNLLVNCRSKFFLV